MKTNYDITKFLDIVMSVCLTKTKIIAGSVEGSVRTFDIQIGRELCDDLGQPVTCISLSNDGDCVLATCLDSTMCLLDSYNFFNHIFLNKRMTVSFWFAELMVNCYNNTKAIHASHSKWIVVLQTVMLMRLVDQKMGVFCFLGSGGCIYGFKFSCSLISEVWRT